MRSFTLALLLLLLPLSANAQSEFYGTWTTYLDSTEAEVERTVYLEIEPRSIGVYAIITKNAECVGYLNRVRLEDGVLTFPGGTEWTLRTIEPGKIEVTFPGDKTPVIYEQTMTNIERRCSRRMEKA
ncbi:hypothetical protein [Salinibacter phage M8CC-19]|uniref:Uncharacterized protein n=2 Tax=Kryptosalinivirus M8CC19 TaxID=2560720 RepID=A0A2I6UGA5_9CAUD|nr:hypothetical protein FGG63_gp13 [Salinibacter phage M8CC-19]AUO78991.1 hypothetical protein [Salinibacter phage M8CC-19]AUO79226.1 hypothetical protein [Salinibacter phage M31CC-1]